MSMSVDAIRKPGGKWHRGGRWEYPGDVHCPTGLGFVLMPRNCEQKPLTETRAADRCRRCFPHQEADQ